ncbi:MAG TPA: segregation/condensation protein A, partial [Nitrosomonas sp.]|nr:segregation/condensation protein A [Nitrosomonas sp.]
MEKPELTSIKVNGEHWLELPQDLYIPPEALRVFLEAFEGPLDLLLYLIKKDNFDILNIPIADITRQYLKYIELMQELKLELAAEYLLMAAMLAEIKSRLLLPKPLSAEETEEGDPRAELVRRLQEYERFQQAASALDQLPRAERDIFVAEADSPRFEQAPLKPDISLEDILQALQAVVTRAKLFASHQVTPEVLSIRERMALVLGRLNSAEFVEFTQFFQAREGKIWKNEVYTTTSPRLAAGVERLILSLGHAARVHRFEDKREERYKDVFEVRLYQSPERAVQKRGVPAYSRKKYRGMVYCAEVPGGLVYVRLGDSIGHWSGNSKTGVTLRLPLGAKKEGNTVTIPVFNLKTGATEHISSKTFLTSKVVLPDQVEFKNGKPTPVRETVKMVGVDNKIMEGTMKEADYVMRHPSQLFNLTSNMIPFIQNDSGGRAGMASRHMEQSISLLHREAPLVQVATPSKQDGVDTFEGLMGKQAAHHSPVDGEVVAIHPTHIQVKDASGKVHTVHTYNNFPLNDTKSVMHATPVVKVGDKVKSGGLLADTNYSKDGKLAIGTNLRIAYMPYKGYNFEDGLVISESAAKKLSSVHLHKQSLALDEKMIRSPREFGIKHVGIFTKAQLEGLDKDGVATVGSIVKPGDPLILASSPYEVKDRTGLAALRKSITSQHSDKSVKWDSEHPGEVVSVHKSGDEVHVHVKTIEPMQIGDKLCFDE